LSLGGGIQYRDLSLRRSGNDLILETGSGDRITFDKWYAGKKYQAVTKLQLVPEATPGFDPAFTETFDFKEVVKAFDTARHSNPGLSRWTLTNAMAHFQLLDGAALGGDLAYQYGAKGTLGDVALGAAQSTLDSGDFDKKAQTLHSASELKNGLVKLS